MAHNSTGELGRCSKCGKLPDHFFGADGSFIPCAGELYERKQQAQAPTTTSVLNVTSSKGKATSGKRKLDEAGN
jgi:hypothetical protein